MSARYRTEAINTECGDGTSRIIDGLEVAVSSPLAADFDPTASNPEQLLALAWVCLNATAQAIVRGERRTTVRVEVELHPVDSGPGYEFHVDGYLSAEGLSDAETADLVAAAHARCPVSKLIGGAATVHAHAEAYVGSH